MRIASKFGPQSVLLAAFALPAVAQSSERVVPDARATQTREDPLLSDIAKEAYRVLKGALKNEQQRGQHALEEFASQRQFTVGRYPNQYEIVEKEDLPSDLLKAAEIVTKWEKKEGTLWAILPARRNGERQSMNLNALGESEGQLARVMNDPFDRALELGLIKMNGTSRVPVDAPFEGSTPFASEIGGNACIKLLPGVPGEVHETRIEVKDRSVVSRPEFARGELAGRNLAASSEGNARNSGFVQLQGSITKHVHDVTYTFVPSPEYQEALGRVDGMRLPTQEMKDELLRLIAKKFPPRAVPHVSDSAVGFDVPTVRLFMAPPGSKDVKQTAEFLAFLQRQIEIDSRNQLRSAVSAIIGRTKELGDGEGSLIQRAQVAKVLEGVGGSLAKREVPNALSSQAEVLEYLTNASFGLTDDSLPDFRQLLRDHLRNAKGENERARWMEISKETEKTIKRLTAEDENGNLIHAPASSSVRYPWSEFPFTLPASEVLPGLLFERLSGRR